MKALNVTGSNSFEYNPTSSFKHESIISPDEVDEIVSPVFAGINVINDFAGNEQWKPLPNTQNSITPPTRRSQVVIIPKMDLQPIADEAWWKLYYGKIKLGDLHPIAQELVIGITLDNVVVPALESGEISVARLNPNARYAVYQYYTRRFGDDEGPIRFSALFGTHPIRAGYHDNNNVLGKILPKLKKVSVPLSLLAIATFLYGCGGELDDQQELPVKTPITTPALPNSATPTKAVATISLNSPKDTVNEVNTASTPQPPEPEKDVVETPTVEISPATEESMVKELGTLYYFPGEGTIFASGTGNRDLQKTIESGTAVKISSVVVVDKNGEIRIELRIPINNNDTESTKTIYRMFFRDNEFLVTTPTEDGNDVSVINDSNALGFISVYNMRLYEWVTQSPENLAKAKASLGEDWADWLVENPWSVVLPSQYWSLLNKVGSSGEESMDELINKCSECANASYISAGDYIVNGTDVKFVALDQGFNIIGYMNSDGEWKPVSQSESIPEKPVDPFGEFHTLYGVVSSKSLHTEYDKELSRWIAKDENDNLIAIWFDGFRESISHGSESTGSWLQVDDSLSLPDGGKVYMLGIRSNPKEIIGVTSEPDAETNRVPRRFSFNRDKSVSYPTSGSVVKILKEALGVDSQDFSTYTPEDVFADIFNEMNISDIRTMFIIHLHDVNQCSGFPGCGELEPTDGFYYVDDNNSVFLVTNTRFGEDGFGQTTTVERTFSQLPGFKDKYTVSKSGESAWVYVRAFRLNFVTGQRYPIIKVEERY